MKRAGTTSLKRIVPVNADLKKNVPAETIEYNIYSDTDLNYKGLQEFEA